MEGTLPSVRECLQLCSKETHSLGSDVVVYVFFKEKVISWSVKIPSVLTQSF